jgi:predicted nucleotidyltransferase
MAERARDGAIGEQVIQEAARRLAEAAGARSRVILFGSHAVGAADAQSDLDFLVIEPEVADRHEEAVRLRDALNGLLVPVDVLVFTEREVEDWRDVPNTVIHAALREGRVLRG